MKQMDPKEEGAAIEKTALAILNQVKSHTSSSGQGHSSYGRGRSRNIGGRRWKYGHWSKEHWRPGNNLVRGKDSYQYRWRSNRYDQYYNKSNEVNNSYYSPNNSFNSRNNNYNNYDGRNSARNESKSLEGCNESSKN